MIMTKSLLTTLLLTFLFTISSAQFEEQFNFSWGFESHNALISADADGDLDITFKASGTTFKMLENDGPGSFTEVIIYEGKEVYRATDISESSHQIEKNVIGSGLFILPYINQASDKIISTSKLTAQ